MANLISINDFDKDKILQLLDSAKQFEKQRTNKNLDGKVIASLFFEPSTRTRLSFESAIQYSGGKVIGFSDSSNSSQSKGESLEDTIKTVSCYCDGIIVRHPESGSAARAAKVSSVPVINAGDGSNEHPTQTLLDLYSIMQTQNTLEGLTIGLAGDLKYGRTVHSLIKSLLLFGANFVLIAPDELQLLQKLITLIEESDSTFESRPDFTNIKDLDILYMTRTQKERFEKDEDYERVKDSLKLELKHLEDVKDNLKILHPLPRVTELDFAIDDHKAAYYFGQVQNGLYVRQALLADLIA